MRSVIETLEATNVKLQGMGLVLADVADQGRHVDDPAVQATIVLIHADQTAIDAAKQQIFLNQPIHAHRSWAR